MSNKTISLILLSFLITTNSFGNNNNFYILKQSNFYEANVLFLNQAVYSRSFISNSLNNNLQQAVGTKNINNNENIININYLGNNLNYSININNNLNNNLDININKNQNTEFNIKRYLEKCEEKLSNKEKQLKIANNWTALMCAARINDQEGVKNFVNLQEGMQDNMKYTALMHASIKGNNNCVKLLMNTKELGMQKKDGLTALMLAAQSGHTDVVELFINTKEVGMIGKNKLTALMLAAYYGRAKVVELLVNTKEVGMQNNIGETAMMLALQKNYIIIEPFIYSEKFRTKSNINEIPYLKINGKTNFKEDIELIINSKKTTAEANTYIVLNDVKKIIKPFMNTKEVGMQNNYGWTALMFAVKNDNAEIVEMFMNTKELNMKNNNNQTALDIAKNYKNKEIIAILKEKYGTSGCCGNKKNKTTNNNVFKEIEIVDNNDTSNLNNINTNNNFTNNTTKINTNLNSDCYIEIPKANIVKNSNDNIPTVPRFKYSNTQENGYASCEVLER